MLQGNIWSTAGDSLITPSDINIQVNVETEILFLQTFTWMNYYDFSQIYNFKYKTLNNWYDTKYYKIWWILYTDRRLYTSTSTYIVFINITINSFTLIKKNALPIWQVWISKNVIFSHILYMDHKKHKIMVWTLDKFYI